ncbi:beta-ketoacyl synthase N-terminal-like domain-containing protein [Spongisporangium articulatum]|uniref:Beta-ketoacyl synthase N-terminal-like domain-containing protein n=1 Tax=Spongisporangium articulatum TaxID=3362603 RepID=A0ABW8AKN7_9ACTN
MSGARTEAELLRWLRDAVADLLDLDASEIDPERPLTELGISSRDAVGLVGELEDYLDRDLDATLVWQTPTILDLARLLASGAELPAAPTAPAAAAPQPAPAVPHEPADGPEPIALIGLGVRLPGGATGPDGFWDLLREGRDAVGTVPDDRWADFTSPSPAAQQALATVNRTGGFLADVAGFDAEYFSIYPREAALMDPQQRMLLEVFVEAVEHAGLDLENLRGSDTGVYVGMSTNEYAFLAGADLAAVDAYMAAGSAFSIAANRISYLFDLRGPSMTLDTACSSSLVAMHNAVRAIRDGDIDTAFVAGVNLLLAPATTMTFGQAGALAEERGCKPFSDDADGIARAEGAGVVVLKKLSRALADGDRVLAVVRGTAVNQDGRSNGLTAPNPLAQEAVLRKAYADAGLPMGGVDYVEAHGTGTLLGDPIEAGALGATLGAGRTGETPLLIGSVKSNLGHPESAAGIAGVIKVVLAMQHDVIPASIKFHGPNPHIRFDDWHLQVAAEATPWPRHTGRAVAGVSGFGFGGTNAHVVLEEYVAADHGAQAAPTSPADDDSAVVVLPLSGVKPERVRDAAERLADHLENHPEQPVAAVAATLTRRRGRAAATSVLAARGRAGAVEVLRAFAAEQKPPAGTIAVRSVPRTSFLHPGTEKAVWVFSGFGQAWDGMGRALLAEEPAFAAAVDGMDAHFVEHAGFSLRSVLAGDTPMDGLAAFQITTFGVQVALAALWRSYGVEPAAVIGHSVGEVAAAVVAGGLSLADGIRIISVRSWLQEEGNRTGTGSMAVLEITVDELDALKDRFPGVVVCVYSSSTMLTVGSADAEELTRLVQYVESLNRTAWPLPVKGAGHSHMVDPYLPRFLEQLGEVQGATPTVPFISTALEDPAEVPTFDQHYWATNARQPVRFTQVVQRLAADGHAAFLEISAHPVAGHPLTQSVSELVGPGLLVLPTLRRGGDDVVTFRSSAMALHRAGLTVDVDAFVPRTEQADLPLPAWRHRRFWVEPSAPAVPTVALGEHPLLGVHVELPEGDRHVWRADIGTAALPWLSDHTVFGVPVLPAAAYAEMALAAGRDVLAAGRGPEAVVLTDLVLGAPMSLGEHTDVTTSLTVTGLGTASLEVWSRTPGSAAGSRMVRNATATVRLAAAVEAGDAAPADLLLDLSSLEQAQPVDLYAALRAAGREPGPSFLGVSEARLSEDGLATARVSLPEVTRFHAAGSGYTVHPVLLDVCLQVLAVSALAMGEQLAEAAGDDGVYLPVAIGSAHVLVAPAGDAVDGDYATARLHAEGGSTDRLTGSVRVVSPDGAHLLELRDVVLRRVGADEIAVPLPELLHDTVWTEKALAGVQRRGSWLLVEAEPGAGADLRAALEGARHRVLDPIDALRLDLGLSRLDEDDDRPAAGVVVVAPQLGDDDSAVGDEPALRAADGLAELVMAVRAAAGVRVWVVTTGGVALGDERGRPALAALRGLVRTAAQEPEAAPVTLLDVDDVASAVEELGIVVPEDGDDEITWRGGTRRVRRVLRVTPDEASWEPRAGGYLITGDLGESSVAVAEWLTGRLQSGSGAGAVPARVLLSGVEVSDVDVLPAVEQLAARAGVGVTVEVLPVDRLDAETVKRQIAAVTTGDVPLRGVLQLPSSSVEDADVLPIAWLLHEAATDGDLDVWALAADASALFGQAGGARAAVRAGWLEALAAWRRAQGLTGSVVRWGEAVTAEQFGQALALLPAGGADLGVARTPAALPGVGYFHELVRSAALDGGDDGWPGPERLRALPPAVARQLLSDRLRSRVAILMGYRPDDVDPNVPLSALGVDSLVALRAKNAVEADVAVTLPVRLLLQGASLADLEQHLATELGFGDVAAAAGPRATKGIEPRDGVERWLVSTWQVATGVRPGGVNLPLAELGDEVAANKAVDAILERLNAAAEASRQVVPTREQLLSAATLAEQSELVRPIIEGSGAADGPLRILAPGELGHRPLFLFHPAGGATVVYHPLVSQLGEDVPVYGFDRLDGLVDIDEKVTTYMELIRQLQPEGPYRMGGWSFGGALAYRTAQRLRAEGDEVEVLFMIDTIMPQDTGQSETEMLKERFGRFLAHLTNTYGVTLDVDLDELVAKPEQEQIDTLMDLFVATGANLSPALLKHQRTSYEDARIAERYTPEAYGAGRVVLYRSTDRGQMTTIDPRYARIEDTLGWEEFCDDLEVVLVPGTHTSIIDRPQVDVMAAHMSRALSEVVSNVR